MSNENEEEVVLEDELTVLKKRADLMGIKYSPNIGIQTLKAKINDKIGDKSTQPKKTSKKAAMTLKEYEEYTRRISFRDAGKKVRVRITCMNPLKKNWEGEIISVGSAKLGTFKEYVPFNTESWHVSNIIYQELKERKCSIFVNTKLPSGMTVRKAKQVNEFSIERLDPLSKEELKDLAQQQAMSGSIDN